LWKENRSGMQMNGLFGEATMIFLPAIDKYCILPLKTKKEWYIAWFTIYSCSYMKWIKQYWLGRLKTNLLAYDQANIAWFTIYSKVQWFFKLTMLHVVLDRQKISKTILEKAFFFILWCFYLFSIFVLINFKIGSSERWKFFFLK
jgi:hypothetical protein